VNKGKLLFRGIFFQRFKLRYNFQYLSAVFRFSFYRIDKLQRNRRVSIERFKNSIRTMLPIVKTFGIGFKKIVQSRKRRIVFRLLNEPIDFRKRTTFAFRY